MHQIFSTVTLNWMINDAGGWELSNLPIISFLQLQLSADLYSNETENLKYL